MRHLAAMCAVLAAGLLAAVPAAGRASLPVVPTRASVESCHTGTDPSDRYAVFAAQMGAIRGSARMQIRFELHGTTGGRWTRMHAPGLDTWYASASPQVAIFRYRKELTQLTAPGTYRAVVRFRWLTARGRVMRTERHTTAACRQPDPRPDLVPGPVSVVTGTQSDRARYLVAVRNVGRGDAGPFTVSLAVAGSLQGEQTVPALPAREATVLTFDGPRCPAGARLRVEVDAAHQIDEAREGNNTLTSRCQRPTTA